jgi:hypothetical protein
MPGRFGLVVTVYTLALSATGCRLDSHAQGAPHPACGPDEVMFDLQSVPLAQPDIPARLVFVAATGCTYTVAQTGALCAAEGDAACSTNLQKNLAAQAEKARVAHAGAVYLVTKSAAGLAVWHGAEPFRSIFGRVDSEEEAWVYLAGHLGYPPEHCQTELSQPCVTQTSAGYSIVVRHFLNPCPLRYQDVRYQVSFDGTVSEEPTPIHEDADRCVS